MRKRKKECGQLGLLMGVMALGVMAFASSAQALTPEYFVGGVLVPAGLNAPVEGKQIGRGTLLVAALNTEFNCEKFSVAEGILTSSKHAKLKLIYEECTVLEVAAPLGEIPCTIKNSKKITATGLILPAELTDGTPAVLVEEIEALFGMEGAECPLPLDNIVKGEWCLKVVGNHTVKPILEATSPAQPCRARPTLNSLVELSGTEAEILALENAVPKLAFLDEMKYGAQPGIVEFKAEVFLGGATHSGKTIGVLLG